ncbi:MAG: branched-chain amino acid ABC transporter ATP-binding protein/permease [Micromonosporaceae bacterium]|jgi:branched-chain amino acid transport system permease protein|nr:branched-chain amino acid ABC transporter ATP-binding protein/permease [Micromonosporaceae bacterium]
MRWRSVVAFPLAIAALATLSLYRETMGFPLFYLGVLTSVLFWTTQATSWNILSGYSGYFSFGQAAYVGVGAYTTAVLYGRHGVNFYLTIPVAAVLCALLAAAIGGLAFRLRSLRGEIFALLTLAVPFILAALARINSTIDGGQGIILAVPPFPAGLGLFQDFLYLISLLLAGAAVWVAYAIQHSRFGWALSAIRDAEDVAEGLGVATFRYKMLAIVASGAIGGVGGSIYALQIGFVTVESVFSLTVPLFVIVMSVLGGRSHWLGPVIGAGLVVLLQDRLSASGLESWRLIVLGAALAVLVVIAPDGLYHRLRAQPWLALAAFAVVTGALWTSGVWGVPLDWILLGALAGAVASIWPRRPRASAPAPAPAVAEPTGTPPAAAGGVLVEARNVAKYFGGVRALADVTLTVREGELVGLVGPNGSGKTTLVSLLAGTLRPTRGSIQVAGRDISGLSPHRVAHAGVARTYQIPRPFGSMTVRDNVAIALMFGRQPLPLAQARRAAEQHIAFVGLSHLAGALPTALNLHQRQLLEIARALATSPRVLLLDEALAGLNPAEIDSAVEVIRRIQRSGTAVVIVEHLLRVVNQLATRVVVLDRGTCLADGDPKTVMSQPEVIRAYLGKRAHA